MNGIGVSAAPASRAAAGTVAQASAAPNNVQMYLMKLALAVL